MDSSILDDVFSLLTLATELEGQSRIEAATKYYEAVYLMKRFLERGLPISNGQESVNQLLTEKIRHYEQVASALIADDSSTKPHEALLDNPRSPISNAEVVNTQRANQSTRSIGAVSNESSDAVVVNNTASQANTKLAAALDLDENGDSDAALAMYIEASELFLRALQAAENLIQAGDGTIETIATTLTRRLTQTLDRVEQLKEVNQKQQPSIGHEQNIISKSKNVSSSPQKIREFDNFSTMSQQSHLTSDEVAVLKRSSLIASGLFLPWSDNDARQLLKETLSVMNHSVPSTAKKFTDPDGYLALSPKQKERFHRWARPSDIVQIRQSTGITRTQQTPVVVRAITPYTIQQQFVTDCSFIASLCICAALERRFRKSLITSVLHPQREDGTILYNPRGKYIVKLWLNGVARSVLIDDFLPIDKYGNLLCSHTSFNPKMRNQPSAEAHLELWVCLIEKAYMKLCGGYDFPGSNSGVDMFSLTGWIPERIMFAKDRTKVKDFETDPERAFERIFSASSFGDCLITVSTELKLSEMEADTVGLVSGHAYAVLDVIQTTNGTRLLQLKNPWAHRSWKGRFSSGDKNSWKDRAFRNEVGYDPDLAATQDDGIFWVCWDDILKYFQNFHMSWNPWLFKYRLVAHGFWPATQGPNDDTFNIGENPQYVLKLSERAIKQKATVWILISRHITKQEQAGVEVKDFLTVHLHRNKERFGRIWYPGKYGNCVLTGAYTNNPHVLVRYDIEGLEDEYLSVVLSQYKKSNDLGYTLSCFCTEDFSLAKPEGNLEHVLEFSLSWTPSLCGGPIGTPSFPKNPMVALKVPEGGAIVQLNVTTSTASAVNALLVPVKSYGEGIGSATGEACIDSGNYRHGFVTTGRRKVRSGVYAVIVSNFHQGQTSPFTLKILSNRTLKANPI